MTGCVVCGLNPDDLKPHEDPELVFETDAAGVTHCRACKSGPPCSCYDPTSMEYGPNYPCPRCQVLETTASSTASKET